jgi:hypothetical protein
MARGMRTWQLMALAALIAAIFIAVIFASKWQSGSAPPVSAPEAVQGTIKVPQTAVAPSANTSKSASAERPTENPTLSQQGNEGSPPSTAGTSPWLAITLVTLSLTAALAIASNLYLVRGQHRNTASRTVAVPEEPGDWPSQADNSSSEFQGAIARSNERQRAALLDLAEQVRRTNTDIANLLETTGTLRNALDERDQEIRRLRQGYDTEVFRRFLSRFIRVRQAVGDFAAGENGQDEAFHQLARLLDDAFEECGVEKFDPPVGADYREAQGVADNPRRMKARRAADAFRIAEVVEPGYRLRSGGGNAVIVPAKVAIYIP